MTQIVALVVAAFGSSVAFVRQDQFEVRNWVTWTFFIVGGIMVLTHVVATTADAETGFLFCHDRPFAALLNQ